LLSKILFLVVLIALNAYFAASEIALISLNDKKIKLLAEEGNKKARLLEQLLGEPSRFLATIQIGITLAGFLASAFAAESFADPIVENLIELGVTIPETIIRLTVVFFITIILSYFTLVLGELVPKRIAMNKAEKISFAVVRSLIILSKITSPFVKLLTVSTDFFVRLLGVDPNSSVDEVTEEEIRMMVDVGEEKGAIHEHEKIMINNIFEFNNKTAEEIMTHRTEMVAFPIDMEIEQVLSLLKTEQYSRIPVYEESLDNIVGILYVKDLLQLIGICNLSEFQLEKFIKKPIFVPTHKKIDELFLNLKNSKKSYGCGN
jgi:putative hemolysin